MYSIHSYAFTTIQPLGGLSLQDQWRWTVVTMSTVVSVLIATILSTPGGYIEAVHYTKRCQVDREVNMRN